MAWHHLLIDQFLLFTLVLARVSGLVMVAPIFGAAAVPMRVRALLAFSIALLVAPLHWGASFDHPGTTLNYLVLVGNEALVGLLLALGVNLLFAGVQVAGQIIGQMSGLQVAEVFSPEFDGGVPVFSQILFYVALAVFVILGGHRMTMEALLDTFAAMPPGTARLSSTTTETLTELLAQSFALGIRAAAPAMVALLLTTLVLGLIGRTLPQLNIMSLGFGLSSLVTLCVLSMSLGAAAWLFQDHIDSTLLALLDTLC